MPSTAFLRCRYRVLPIGQSSKNGHPEAGSSFSRMDLVKIIVFLAGRNRTDMNCHYTTFFRLISANYRSVASLMRPPERFLSADPEPVVPKFWFRGRGIRRADKFLNLVQGDVHRRPLSRGPTEFIYRPVFRFSIILILLRN